MTWTMGRQLASFGNISYTYNEAGIRTSKTSNGVTTKFYLDGTRLVEQTDGNDTLHFNYDRYGEVIGFTHYYLSTGVDDPIMVEYIYVKNAQGDVVGITTPTGEIKVSYAYDPWGNLINVETNFGQYERDVSALNPFRYRSYYYDSDIQMYYLQSRCYDPEVGRFINCDDVNFMGITESEVSYNPFAYCENNPVNSYDSDGYLFEPILQLFKFVFKIITDIRYIGKLLNEAINLSQYSSWIRSMKAISYNVNYNKKYDLYEINTFASTKKWYYQESFTIITYSTSVENWYNIYDDVNSDLRSLGIANTVWAALDVIYNAAKGVIKSIAVNAALSKLSAAAAIIGISVGILTLVASDAVGVLESKLRFKDKSDIYTFNWVVTYTSAGIGKTKTTEVLEWYCYLAYFMGANL